MPNTSTEPESVPFSRGEMASETWVYPFRSGSGKQRDLLGGKGANLAEMTNLGLPVPPGFVISTRACLAYSDSGKQFPTGLWDQTLDALKEVENATGRTFGDPDNPLLVSVRSGARVSMPGMMDTVLNLGINGPIAESIGRLTKDPAFGLDLHRRFIQMYGNVVLGVGHTEFEEIFEEQERQYAKDGILGVDGLSQVVTGFKALVEKHHPEGISDDPYIQLEHAIRAVFKSWNTRRAIDYRNYHNIPHDLGTAVNVMTMVYGNADEKSGSGVIFTRDPATGENILYGEYLINAQGEEVVAGVATPKSIADLEAEMPDIYAELKGYADKLELHYKEVQDIEFTIERGKLHILQTRDGKRGAKAAIKFAVDLAEEGVITREQAVDRVSPDQVSMLLLPRLDADSKEKATKDNRLVAVGLGASPGGASGTVVFTADEAVRIAGEGTPIILVRSETSAEDVHGMLVSAGVLTSRGGATSHAAVVARGLGKACVTGTESLDVDYAAGVFRCRDLTVKEGDQISIDGASGEVFLGAIDTIHPRVSDETEMATLLSWADKIRRLRVWANADNERDATVARELGAQGIGLCRTEHMFFEPKRLDLVRKMILAARASDANSDDAALRKTYLDTLESLQGFQVPDFEGIFRVMDGLPVVIRLLDPPLHEFLPSYEELLAEVVELRVRGNNPTLLAEREKLMAAVGDMREANPMLGLRGCRLGLIYPDIYDMQVRAILTAAVNVAGEGLNPIPEIMLPLVVEGEEMSRSRRRLEETIDRFQKDTGKSVDIKIGTMIETPRAALRADDIAEFAEFFSFGTNDLTQMTFGFSRDDAEGKFLSRYIEDKIFEEDPFQVLDRSGVGRLVEIACELGKKKRPGIELGICGEHGGDPSSIEFFDEIGLNYVSCSPHRVPVARLAAAQTTLRAGGMESRGDTTL